MARVKYLVNSIKEIEYELAKQKAIFQAFPNAKMVQISSFNMTFRSKDVNQKYTNFEFLVTPNKISFIPYCDVFFTFDNDDKNIKVYGCPKANRLVYLDWGIGCKYVIKFARVEFNFQKNQIRDGVLDACREQIISFIEKNSSYPIDDKHLEPRLKKLLAFL